MNIIIVFLFGFLGGLSRYEVNLHLPQTGHFPLATLLINLLGCYLFTFLVKNYLQTKKVHQKLILGIGTGFIGAFTTFSTFIMDSEHLLLLGDFGLLTLYVFLSIVGGLLMAFLGMRHGRRGAQRV